VLEEAADTGPCTSSPLAHRFETAPPLPEEEVHPMKAEKTLLLIALTLILVVLFAGITRANPGNQANTPTGTVPTKYVQTPGTVPAEGESSSTGDEFTFTGTLQYK
jgi:hypothetical protein